MGKWNYSSIKDCIEGEEGNECKLITTQEGFEEEKIKQNKTNSNVNLKILCGACKKEVFEVNIDRFKGKNKTQCNICSKLISSRKNIKWDFNTLSEYIKRNSKCTLLGFKRTEGNISLSLECDCGNHFERTLSNFKKNVILCPECSGVISYNIEKIKHFVENNSECELLSNSYKNNNTPMRFKCKCRREFTTTWAEFVNQNRRQCSTCGQEKSHINHRKWNDKILSEFISENTECEFISFERIKKRTKTRVIVTLQCKCKQRNIFKRDIDSIKRNLSNNEEVVCRSCSRSNISHKQKHNLEFVKNEFIKKGYTPLFDSYENANEKLTAQDNNGYKICVTYHRFQQNEGNKIFHKRNPYTYDNIKLYLVLNEPKYKLLSSEYKSYSDDKLVWKCEEGHEFPMSLDCFVKGIRCPLCSQSKGEKRVGKYLESHNITYNNEHEFEDLKGDHDYLRFDFAVFKNDNLDLLIEYDGEMHYLTTTLQNDLEKQQRYDNLKNEYCKQNKIKLIRIPYWDFDNIEEILEKELKISK